MGSTTFLLIMAMFSLNPITVSVYPAHAFVPATFRITVLAPRHVDNRRLCLGYRFVDEREPIRNSCQPLDGINGTRVRTVYWDIRTAGEYEAISELVRVESGLEKRYVDRRPFRVLGSMGLE